MTFKPPAARPSGVDTEGAKPDGHAKTGRHPLIGALKGLIHVEPGVDLTAPADPDWGNRVWVE